MKKNNNLKQTKILIDRGDTGNFLNMPYHSDSRTTRYAFDDNGEALNTKEFLDYVQPFIITPNKFRKLDTSFGTDEEVLQDGPPCLQHLCRKGFGEGSRNNALFNLGVYARMSDGDNWEVTVQRYNMDFLKPPL